MPSDDDSIVAAVYDEIAAKYAQEMETNPYNTELEFPGTTALIPDVTGKRVLDAGCGSGLYTEWLVDQGAEVVAMDASENMLSQAKKRLGTQAEFYQGDLEDRLDFAEDEAFDGVISALVLHYLKDWRQPLAEFARVLKPGGFLVFSVGHPVEEYVDNENVNYFETEQFENEWWSVEIPYYRRPLFEMLSPLLEAGFQLDGIVEPQPTDAFKEKQPEAYEKESQQPVFLCLRAVKSS